MSTPVVFRRLRTSPLSRGGIVSPRADNSERIWDGSLRFICSSSCVCISLGRWLFDADTRLNERRLPLVLVILSFSIRMYPPLPCARPGTNATAPGLLRREWGNVSAAETAVSYTHLTL